MTWQAIAKKDFRQARRSKTLWGTTILFLSFVGLLMVAVTPEQSIGENLLRGVTGAAVFFVPITVLVVSYLAIAGERSSGSIKYLLGLPNTHGEVIVGKFVGRSLVAIVGVLVALLGGAVIMVVRFGVGTLPVVEFVLFTLLTLLFAIVYVGIGVGISALTGSRIRAIAGAVGAYLLLNVVWLFPRFNVRAIAAFVTVRWLNVNLGTPAYDLIHVLSPAIAYRNAVFGLVFDDSSWTAGLLGDYPDGLPFFLEDWFMPVILIAWIVVFLGVGYARFKNSELA